MFRADWNWWSNSRPPPVRAAAPEDLVGSDGGCSPGGTGPVGITLGITECDLVRTAGPTDQIVIGANDRGERTAVITYPQGERAGVYRFTGGLLTVIDRVPEPESPQRRPARRQRG